MNELGENIKNLGEKLCVNSGKIKPQKMLLA
jgi:hypothetical protein